MGLKQLYAGSPKDLLQTTSSLRGSPLIPVSPEYSNGEVLIGSMYRLLITGVSESKVNPFEIEGLPSRLAAKGSSSNDDEADGKKRFWETILLDKGSVASVRTPKAKSLQLSPIVPSISRYALAIGKPRNRFDPSTLVFSAFGSGCSSLSELSEFLEQLAIKLGITEADIPDEQNDDYFALFVETHLKALDGEYPKVDFQKHASKVSRFFLKPERGLTVKIPGQRLLADFKHLLELKDKLTRRQWISLLESSVRIGTASHFLWTCMMVHSTWELLVSVLEGQDESLDDALQNAATSHVFEDNFFLELMATDSKLKVWISRWYRARIGLALVLNAMDDINVTTPEKLGIGSKPDTIDNLVNFLESAKENRKAIEDHFRKSTGSGVRAAASNLWEQHPRQVECLSGSGKNAFEFAKHVLRQLEAETDGDRNYDQGFFTLKIGVGGLDRKEVSGRIPPRGGYAVSPGPLAMIMLVGCTTEDVSGGLANIGDLKRHLAEYGINSPPEQLITGRIAEQLRELGLIADSPDARDGLSLVNPLPRN